MYLLLFGSGCLLTILTSVQTPLPHYSGTASFIPPGPFSPTPTYYSMHISKPQNVEPQEIMGLGLTADEFSRRNKSRSPVYHTDGPVELATHRFSAPDPNFEATSPLLESKPRGKSREISQERSSRLRTRPAIRDLRAEASRSPSRSPARGVDLGG